MHMAYRKHLLLRPPNSFFLLKPPSPLLFLLLLLQGWYACITKGSLVMESIFFSKVSRWLAWAAKYWEPRMKMMWHLLFFLVQIFINAQEELTIKNVFVVLILEHWIDTLIYLCAYGNTQILSFTSLKIKRKGSLLDLQAKVWVLYMQIKCPSWSLLISGLCLLTTIHSMLSILMWDSK